MAKISNTTNYPTKGSPVGTDYVIGTDASSKETKTFTLQSIANLYSGSGSGTVTSVALSGGTTGLTVTGSPVTNSGTITLAGTLATTNGGTGLTSIGTSGQVLKVNSGATGLEWGTAGGTTYTAGDGLDLIGSEFSTDLKANGGLVIESTELAVDLGASSITGTLGVADGGTGVNTLGANRLILGNGTSAVTSLSSQTKGTMVVGDGATTNILAVGTDGHVLTAASGEATGVRWTATTVAAGNITGTLSVNKGGTGSSTAPAAAGSISFSNSTQNGYDTNTQFKYDQDTLRNVTTSTTTPAIYLSSANATSVGGVGGTYTGGIGAVNIENTSNSNNSVPLVISSPYPQGGAANVSRLVTFYGGSSGAPGSFRCGDIFTNSSVPDVSLTNASDYRLKENIVPLSNSTSKIKELNPVSYNMIGYSQVAEGFLAHELQQHFPNAVVGEKDAVDSDGNINPQMVDYTKVIPALVGAIKELTARIEALEG